MPACARCEIVLEGEIGVYHVWTRCVRRAFLCGEDPATGADYEHRRQWIRDYLPRLCQLFAVEAGFHVEMQNQLHLLLRNRPDVVETWSDKDCVRRWLAISRLVHSRDGRTIHEITEPEVRLVAADPDRVAKIRTKLSSVSHFMAALSEHISRRANREEGVKGAFFESRFKSRRIEYEAGILVCGMYIDLNQIRAGETLTPEESRRTSAFDRIAGQNERQTGATESAASDGWLCELSYNPRADAFVPGPQASKTGRRASDRGLLPMKLADYLELLDWTGRQLARGKTGKIPARLAPILERIGMAAAEASGWLDLVVNFDKLFTHVVGTSEQLVARAAEAGRRCYRGRANCQAAFG